MKLFPSTTSLFDDAFDDFMVSPFWQKDRMMKTDISEKDGNYILDMEMPGCKKEDIKITLHDGYLEVSANQAHDNKEEDDKGNVIRQERYRGTYQRSFYVGKGIAEEDVKASYVNGELKIIVPKAKEALPEKKTISIE